jgi:hypothetical protein
LNGSDWDERRKRRLLLELFGVRHQEADLILESWLRDGGDGVRCAA